MSSTTSKTDHEAAILTAQKQWRANVQSLKDRADELADCIAKPAFPDWKKYVAARIELPILGEVIAEENRLGPEERNRRIGEEYIKPIKDEIVASLRAELTERTKGRASLIETIAGKVAAAASRVITAIKPEDAEKARADRDRAEAEAADIEIDIAAATTAIRTLEITASLANYYTAAACVRRINFSIVG